MITLKKLVMFRQGIQMQMAFRVMVVITLTFCLLGLFQYYEIQVGTSKELLEFAEGTVVKLAEYLQTPMWYANQDLANKTLDAAMLDKTVYAIIVRDENAKLFVGKMRDQSWQVVEATQKPEGDVLDKRKEIIKEDGTPIGSVELYLTTQFLHAKLTQEIRKIAMTLILVNSVVFLLSWLMMRDITRSIRQIVGIANVIAQGNLSHPIQVTQRNEIGELAKAFQHMKEQLLHVITNIQTIAECITRDGHTLKASSKQMSQNASVQAAAAEEVSASMEQMVATIRRNADNAQQTEQIAKQTAQHARASNETVKRMVIAMQKIAQKILSIEDIALQTRILSLNATIEAAKAQEYGKGFAVVATEVRSLAQRSQEVASEINSLASTSVQTAEEAAAMLDHLEPDIHKTAELVQEITAASWEQNKGAEQINKAIQQLDHVIQQYTVFAEELTAKAETLSSEAKQLQDTVIFFKLQESSPTETLELQHALKALIEKWPADLIAQLLEKRPSSKVSWNEEHAENTSSSVMILDKSAQRDRDDEFERF